MNNSIQKPPVISRLTLSFLLNHKHPDTVLADFDEQFCRISQERGRFAAIPWFWLQIVVAIPSFVSNSIYWSVTMFKSYFVIALRNMRKRKAYSFINITGLAVGFACCFLILHYIIDELTFDTFHKDSERIFRVVRVMPDIHGPSTRNPLAPTLKTDFAEVEYSARVWHPSEEPTIIYGEQWFKETGLIYAGPDFLDIFSFDMVSGDRETALDEPNSMVITETTALKYFGSENPIGKSLSYDGAFDFVVTGVVKDVPYNSHFTFDFLLPIESYNAIAGYEYAFDASSYRITDQWNAGMFRTYIKLAEDTSPADLEAKLPGFLEQYSQFNRELLDQRLYLQPIQDIHLFSQYSDSQNNISDIGLIYALSAMGMLILIMACFNYMNLSTAGYSTRAREVGMRKVVGAHRSQLVKQFFGESIVFSVVSLFISMIVVAVVMPFYNDITGKTVSLFGSAGIFTDPTLFGGLIGIVFFSALIAGSYPAVFLSGFRPVSILYKQSGEAGKSFGLRNILIVFQYGISIFLLICSGFIYYQVDYMKNKDLGYTKEQIVVIPVKDDLLRQQNESIKSELIRFAGISDVSFSSVTPASIIQSTTVDIIIDERRRVFELSFGYVDYSFAELYELEFTQGRNYSPDFPSDAGSSAIINETAASMFGWDSPLGQQMPNFGGRTVIGVVNDFHYQSLQLPVGPLILLPGDQNIVVASVKISTENIPSTLDMLETTWKKFSPDRPFEYTFFDTQFEQLYRAEEMIGRTAGYFTLLAIFIASLGLFGLALFTVEQKTREIGIRKVLGATVPGIVNLLAKDFLKLVAVANFIAWPIAYFVMDKWLQGFAFHIDIGIGVFVLSALLALGIALLTVSFQAVKAALSNPVDSLRYE